VCKEQDSFARSDNHQKCAPTSTLYTTVLLSAAAVASFRGAPPRPAPVPPPVPPAGAGVFPRGGPPPSRKRNTNHPDGLSYSGSSGTSAPRPAPRTFSMQDILHTVNCL